MKGSTKTYFSILHAVKSRDLPAFCLHWRSGQGICESLRSSGKIHLLRSIYGSGRSRLMQDPAMIHCSCLLLSPYSTDVHETLGYEINGSVHKVYSVLYVQNCGDFFFLFRSLTFLCLLDVRYATKLSGC